MEKINIKKIINIKNIIGYIFVILLIFECNSVYSQIYKVHYYTRGLMVLMLSGIMVSDIVIKKFKKNLTIHKPILYYIIFDLICSALMLIKTNNNTGRLMILMYFIMFMPIFLLYLSNIEYIDVKKMCQNIVNVVVMLSIVSMFFWLFGSILNIVRPLNEIKVVWARPYSLMDNYYGLYFDSHQDIYWLTNSPIPRNIGIFGEAPMFAAVIMFAMTIFCVINNKLSVQYKKNNILKLICLVATMFSTLSVTGIMFSLIIVVFYSVNFVKRLSVINKKIFSMCFITCIIVLLPMCIQIFNKKVNSSSAIHRNMDINNGIHAFMENPIIGKGINHSRGTEADAKNGYGYSNAIIPIITDGGIILGMLYLFPMILFLIKLIKDRKINDIVIFILYVMILFTTIIQYRMMMLAFIGIIFCFSFKNIIWDRKENESRCLNDEKKC